MSSDSGNGRHKPRRKATRARGSRPNAPEPAPTPPPEPPRYAPRGGESPFWANAQPRTDSQAWADTQALLEARRADSTPQYAPRPAAEDAPLRTTSGDASSRGWVTQSPAPAAPEPAPAPESASTRRDRRTTPAEDLAGLGAWATTPPEPPKPASTVGWRPSKSAKSTPPDSAPSATPPTDSPRAATTSTESTFGSSRAASTPIGSTSSARDDSTSLAAGQYDSTAGAPSSAYAQPPVASVADPRTARGATELSGPRTGAIRERQAAASRPRPAADSTAVDADGRPLARTGRGGGGKRRPFVAVAAVLLVITPISWILLHQPQNDSADASLPIGTRTDDSYATPSTVPVDAPTSAPPKTPPVTPTVPPTGTPTTPTTSVTPTTPPTGRPTNTPTTVPTDHPTSTSTTVPTVPNTPRPSTTPTDKPTNTPPPPQPPPPTDDGDMDGNERQLFNSINDARRKNGCEDLKSDTGMTRSAESEAEQRADNNTANSGDTGSKANVGGDSWSADKAFDEMMSSNRSTLMNCSFTTMSVGRGTDDYKTGPLCGIGICSERTRVAWVAVFR